MSGSFPVQKRGLDSAEDGRESKKARPPTSGNTSQTPGSTEYPTVAPFNIQKDDKGMLRGDVWDAVPGMSRRRYVLDLRYIWKQTEIGDTTIKDMHEQWFQVMHPLVYSSMSHETCTDGRSVESRPLSTSSGSLVRNTRQVLSAAVTRNKSSRPSQPSRNCPLK